ncbi:MAG: hypothetical protein ABIG34_04580 [Candidatus Peregrinibacteria bacterium]
MVLHPKAQAVALSLQYEVDMFISTAAQLNPENDRPLFGGARNAMLESFLIHARVLKGFFFDAPSYPDDVSAKHFFDNDQDWPLTCEGECPYLYANMSRISKAVAHLSYERIGYEEDKNWDIRSILHELMTVWERFLSSLPHDRRRWFPDPKERASMVV